MRIRRWKNLFGRIKVLKVLVFSVSREIITDLPPYTALTCCEGENNTHMGTYIMFFLWHNSNQKGYSLLYTSIHRTLPAETLFIL